MPETSPQGPSNLLEVLSLAQANRDVWKPDVSKFSDTTREEIMGVRGKRLTDTQLGRLNEAIQRNLAAPDDPDHIFKKIEQEGDARRFYKGDEDYLKDLSGVVDFDDPQVEDDSDGSKKQAKIREYYDRVARAVLGTPTAKDTQIRGRQQQVIEQVMSQMPPELQQQMMMAQMSGNVEQMQELMQQYGIPEGLSESFMNMRDPELMFSQAVQGLKKWRTDFRDRFDGVVHPGYAGIPEFDPKNPRPEDMYWLRRIKTEQYVARLLYQEGISGPLDILAQYAQISLGAELSDAPEQVGHLVAGIKAVKAFVKAFKGAPEGSEGNLAGQWDDQAMHLGMQALLSVRYPIIFESDSGMLVDQHGDTIPIDEAKGREIQTAHEWFGAGEALAELRGENEVALEFAEDGSMYFVDASGNKKTMADLSEDERRLALIDENVRFSFMPDRDLKRFGRYVPAQAGDTKNWQEKDRTGADTLIKKTTRELKRKGFPVDKITGVKILHTDGGFLNLNHPYIREYAAAHGYSMAEISAKLITDAVLLNNATKDLGSAMGTMMQYDWTDDLRRYRDHQAEMIKKGVLAVFDQLYYNKGPAAFRVFKDPLHDQVTSWKIKDTTVLGVSLAGNPTSSRLSASNTISKDHALLIPPLMVKQHDGAEIAIHQLPKNQGDRITNTILATKYTRGSWRSQVYKVMTPANVINQMVAERSPEAEIGAYARRVQNDAIDLFGADDGPPQRTEKSFLERAINIQELSGEHRLAISQVNFRGLCELLEGKELDLPDEEFMGVFGLMRFSMVDSVRHNLMDGYEHGFKYTINYPDMARAGAKGLDDAYKATTNAIDHRLEVLFGEVPDQFQSLFSESMSEALAKRLVDQVISLVHARFPKETLAFVDEFAAVYLEKVYPQTQLHGPQANYSAVDVILTAHAIKERAVDLVKLKYGGSGKGIAGDSVDMLELDPSTLTSEQLANWQYYQLLTGNSVNFDYMADPADYRSGNTQEVAKQAKRDGRKLPKPYVRRGRQAVLVEKVKRDDEGNWQRVLEKHRIQEEHGHLGGEKLWLKRIAQQLKDKWALSNEMEAEIMRRLSLSKRDFSEGIIVQEMQAEAARIEGDLRATLQEINVIREREGKPPLDIDEFITEFKTQR